MSPPVDDGTLTELVFQLGEELFCRMEAEQRFVMAVRVATEAMKLLTPEQMTELRRRMDALEVGENDGGPGRTG